ncbi:hypothetical protein AAA799B03_01247 [Marine Group I thaumarchaeote SCGC AAA799-B03]|uniref:Uncharacterized protein n=1 Tax=Marine Group I thaumarchaeote SCGC AAA799-B03 TaxID=1502289 RepID=A0A087S667_9ARCH|nr:hypothetical protein AAA799B03_01247 [Marine Group I thaumarchaeote SCGC AAA799-B03]
MEFFLIKQIKIIVFFFTFSILLFSFVPSSYAHLEYSSSGGVMSGKYFSFIGFEPRNPIPKEPASIVFSIQDKDGNDIYDIETMVEIYNANMEKRLFYEPWIKRSIGDFEIPFVFEEKGTYQIVLSISEQNNPKEHVVVPRQMPSSSSNCDCVRVLFNVSVSENWSYIWNSLMVVVVVLPFAVFGYAMWNNYKNKNSKLEKYELVRYSIMFLAFAGGIIHLTIYIDHTTTRIEYGMFLLLAAISQIGFGVLFLATLLSDSTQKEFRILRRRNAIIYLFGLIGSIVLLGLYLYAITFPPPFSPENHPEHIDIAGIAAKILEISLIGMIVYVMYQENKRNKSH